MKTINGVKLQGDSSKTNVEEDFFGTMKIAEGLADTMSNRITVGGYCLGIEGRWGTGKTTLSNFIEKSIKESDAKHALVRFEPWLMNNRDAMLFYFFGLVAKETESILRKQGPSSIGDSLLWRYRVRKFSRALRKYGSKVALLSASAASAASIYTTGNALLAVPFIKAGEFVGKLFTKNRPSLENLRARVEGDLQALARIQPQFRISIVIDDLDRLEPKESVEIIRVITKVANFDYLNYLIFFDEEILSDHMEVVLNVKSGRGYLEKIFQNIISMPPFEPFALRRYFRSQLAENFPIEAESGDPREIELRVRRESIFDSWVGRFVETPRDANRILDGVRLVWPYIQDRADFFDLVWLQVVKVKFPELYSWTKSYVSELGAYRDGGRASDGSGEDEAKSLSKIMASQGWSNAVYKSGLSYFLPGISSFVLDGEKKRVFNFDPGELSKFENNRRLGSPQHWRLYFAFDLPSYAVENETVEHFRNALSGKYQEAINIINGLMAKPHERKGHFVGVLLDRLKDEPPESFSSSEMEGMVRVFSEVMDEYAERMGQDDLGRFGYWSQASGLLGKSGANRFLEEVKTGRSLSWMADVVRDQGHAHGRPDENRARPDHQWLSHEQLDQAIVGLTTRFGELGLEDIFKKPGPLEILYCWLQLGSEEEVQQVVADFIVDDHNFLMTLQVMRGWSQSASGVSHPVRRTYVQSFMNADEAQSRLREMAISTLLESDVVNKAKELMTEWSDR